MKYPNKEGNLKKCGAKIKKKSPLGDLLILSGAGNEVRTRDPNHGKVMLYQLSYSRISENENHYSIFF